MTAPPTLAAARPVDPGGAGDVGHAELDAFARSLPTATPELIAARALQVRKDWKFVFPIHRLADVLAGLPAGLAALWAGDRPVARYDTLYFDTEDRSLFRDHRRGRVRRHKVRYREYPDRQTASFEVKSKDGRGDTHKARLERPFGHPSLDEDVARFVDAHLPGLAPQLGPALSIRFHRLTLVGVDVDERLTLDVGLTFDDGDHVIRLDDVVVAEVKSATGAARTRSLAAFRAVGLRPSAFSKYLVGGSLLWPALASHRHLARLPTPEPR